MSDLLDFTREEWADKPYLIELRDGHLLVERFRWHCLPPRWRRPEPPMPPTLTLVEGSASVDAISSLLIAAYRETGSVTDGGVHVYEFDGYE